LIHKKKFPFEAAKANKQNSLAFIDQARRIRNKKNKRLDVCEEKMVKCCGYTIRILKQTEGEEKATGSFHMCLRFHFQG